MDINSIVSENLKELREARNLSLEQVAKHTGVSKSMLGQIERKQVTPSISVLWKIASGLKISFTALASAKENDAAVIKRAEIEPISEDGGKYLNYQLFPFKEGRPFEIYRIVIEPGGLLHAEPHLAKTEEYLTVFSGALSVVADGAEYGLSKGDSLRFKADVPHSYGNNGAERVEMSMVIYYP